MKKTVIFLCLFLSNHSVFCQENKDQPEHSHSGSSLFYSKITSPTNIRYFLPDLSFQQLQNMQQPKIGFEGYYALLIEQHQDKLVESEIQYVYKNGRPFSSEPSALFSLEKTKLEIEPTPHPAEHNVYNAGKTWHFKVRFNGKPLANSLIILETENKTKIQYTSDNNGLIAVTFPDDFSYIKPGLRANRPASYRLTANLDQDGKTYVSSLVSQYYVSPSHWQTLEGGIWVSVSGLIFGILLSLKLSSKPLKQKKYQG